MAVTSRDIIKTWFQTNDYPTQDQFWSFIDSMFHVNDTIGIANVTNLNTILQGKADAAAVAPLFPVVIGPGVATWQAPAGTLIEKILIIEPTNINVHIGTTNGGSDILEASQVATGSLVVSSDIYFPGITTIYFTGITVNTIIKIFKR